MTRPRSIPFQKAAVTSRPAEQRPPEAAPKLRFSDLLKARRPSNGAEAKGVDPALDDEHADEDIPVAELPVEAKDESSSEPDRDPADDLDTEWLDALVPTPESMGPLLEESRVAAAARAKAVADAPPVSPVVGEIAKTVARFCNERQVDASEGWQVRMPLNRDVLPETVMQLAISPYWLQLRFETSDDGSRNLLFKHRDALTEMIGNSLNRRRDVAISID